MGTLVQERTYKTSLINNRRYLGNKYKLLSFIKGVVETECNGIESVADIFAGTGAVSSAFSDNKTIITNDLMYSNSKSATMDNMDTSNNQVQKEIKFLNKKV